MPQLIAMVIVVVGAMIYMFQTFGGTGDKIEGVAQKTSAITEINNVRNALNIALRSGGISSGEDTTLTDLAQLGYFADQMNREIRDNAGATTLDANGANDVGTLNTYSAISFGGENNPGMIISMIVGDPDTRPGIRVQLLNELTDNVAFLETEIANDLSAIASVDRTTIDGTPVVIDENGNVPAANRPSTVVVAAPSAPGTATGDTLTDGIFTIYYKDMQRTIIQ